jgi:hypothetical protein
MSLDFQVVFPQELVPIDSVTILQGVNPPSVDVIGQDFRSVDEVRINDVASPDVVILSRRRLLAQIPTELRNQVPTSVTVISNKLAMTNKSVLRFRVGRVPSTVGGVLRLVQVFLKILLTTPGRDIFAPRIGAGALKNIGLTFGKDEGGSIVSDFIVSVATAQRQIIAIQSRDPSLPPDERLLAAKVVSAGYNRNEAALVVSVEITSQAGRAARANVVV